MPQSFASPLAQIYPPLVEVENIPEEQPERTDGDNTSTTGPAMKGTGVSSVPFARKRMLSMQSPLAASAKRGNVDFSAAGHSNSMQPRKVSGPTMGEKSQDIPVSTSPEQIVEGHQEAMPTVSEVKGAEEDASVDFSVWDKRLEEIEKRQARMETLLEQIAARL